MNDRIELYGNAGNYIADGNVLSFQIGEGQQLFNTPGMLIPQENRSYLHEHQWLSVNGYQVCMRGANNNWKSHTNLTHPGKYFRPSKVKIMRPTSPK